jgi:sugar diacid utilization regulator
MDSFNQSKMLHSLFNCKSLQTILDTGRTLYPHPLILCDLTHRLLAITKEPNLNNPPWNEIISTGGIPLDWVNQMITNPCYRRSIDTGMAQLDDSGDGSPIMLRRALSSDGKIIGYLDSPCYRDSPFTEEEKSYFDLIADLCTLRMEKDHNYMESPENMLEFFISDLLEGRIVDERIIEAKFRNFNWNFKTPFHIMTVRYNCGEEWPSNLILQDVCQRLSAAIPLATVFVCGRNLKVLIPPTAASILSLPRRKDLVAILEREQLSAGVSRPCQCLANFAEFNIQSEKALELGTLLRKDNCVFYYDDYAIFHTLDLCSGATDLMRLCHSAIYTLAEYDHEHETNLLTTLEAYLLCHLSIPDAANMLSIHRNSMSYRIKKIYGLLNIDLESSETLFHLLFSYHILEYYSATVMRDQEEQRRRMPIKRG